MVLPRVGNNNCPYFDFKPFNSVVCFLLHKELYNIFMLKPIALVFGTLLLFTMKSAFSRTMSTPARESAVIYYLQITDLSSQKSFTLESEAPEFELPEDLEGTYSIKASFKDKWGREVKGENPKTITMQSKAPLKNDKDERILSNKTEHNVIILTPYLASGTTEINLKANLTNKTKFTSPLSAQGLKVISPLYRTEKWRIGLDVLRASNEKSTFNSTELDLGYNWIDLSSGSKIFLITLNGAYAKTDATIESIENSDTSMITSQANTVYVYSKGAVIIRFDKVTFDLNAMLGGSISYFRYSAGSSIIYRIKQNYSLGPSFEYAKFENGASEESIKANMIKIGLNLIFNL